MPKKTAKFKTKLKKFVKKLRAGRNTKTEELDDLLEQGNRTVYTQEITASTEIRQARETLADIEVRHAAIIKLENDVRECHNQVKEIALCVERQVEHVDTIENHGIQASDDVRKGLMLLKLSRWWQANTKKKERLVIIFLVAVIVSLSVERILQVIM